MMPNDAPIQNRNNGVSGPPAPDAKPRPPLLARWWIYQRERFPLATHIPLIAAFSFCTLSFSMLARGHRGAAVAQGDSRGVRHGPALLPADAHRRRVQRRRRGCPLSSLSPGAARPHHAARTGLVAVGAGVVQVLLALWLSPALLPFLVVTWAYLGLMCREFFVRDWLKAHPADLHVEPHADSAADRPLWHRLRLARGQCRAAARPGYSALRQLLRTASSSKLDARFARLKTKNMA